MTDAPYTFAEAREHARRSAVLQEGVEQALREAARDFALAEERYRVSLAKEIVRQHDAEGVAWSVAPDLARGNPEVAKLRRDRDIAEGVREAMQQQAWRRAADRKDTARLIEWSFRRELAEGYGATVEPENVPAIGGRRVA